MKKLEEIKKYTEQATPGPWEVDGFDSGHSKFDMALWVNTEETGDLICDMDGLGRAGNEKYKDSGGADAWFISQARSDVPKLVKALEGVLEYVTASEENGVAVEPTLVRWFVEKTLTD